MPNTEKSTALGGEPLQAAARAPARRRAAPRGAAWRAPPCRASRRASWPCGSPRRTRSPPPSAWCSRASRAADSSSAPCAAGQWRARCRRPRRRRGRGPRRSRARARSASSAMSIASSILPSAASSSRRPPSGSVADRRKRLAFDLDQLEAAAAEVAGDPVRRAEAHHDAVGSELRLALAGEHLDAGAERLLAAGDEVGSVGGIAAGGGGDRPHVLDAEDAGDDLEPAQRLERQLDASSPRRPVEPTWRPRPHSTFSLKIGVGLLTAPS